VARKGKIDLVSCDYLQVVFPLKKRELYETLYSFSSVRIKGSKVSLLGFFLGWLCERVFHGRSEEEIRGIVVSKAFEYISGKEVFYPIDVESIKRDMERFPSVEKTEKLIEEADVAIRHAVREVRKQEIKREVAIEGEIGGYDGSSEVFDEDSEVSLDDIIL